MVRMTCTCGAELSNHEAPNNIQLRVYTDREWDEIFDGDNKELPIMIYRLEM